MDLLYRFFGLVARIMEKGSRFSVNMIPVSWIAAFLLAFVFALSVHKIIESHRNSSGMKKSTIAQIINGDWEDRLVEVPFEVDTDQSMEKTDKSGKVISEYVAVVDPEHKHGIILEVTGSENLNRVRTSWGGTNHATGMVRKIDNLVAKEVRAGGFGIPAYTSRDFMLVLNDDPADMSAGIFGAAASGVLLAAMILAFVFRYTVFRRGGGLPDESPAERPVSVALGVFHLENVARRFHGVGAIPLLLDDGNLGLLSNVDASSRFMGAVTKNLQGIWAMIPKQGTVQPPEFGRCYLGFSSLPAMRIRYTDAVDGKPRKAVIAANTDADLVGIHKALFDPEFAKTLSAPEPETPPLPGQNDGRP